MLDVPRRPVLHAALVGPVAARALREGARGEIRAVFARSLYLTLGPEWVCLGAPGLGAGPLHLLCAWPARGASALRMDQTARVEGAVLHAGPLSIHVAGAPIWLPEVPRWDQSQLAHGLAAFAAALPGVLPEAGLARLLRPAGVASPLLDAVRGPVLDLARVLRGPLLDAPRAASLVDLVGLGPGLTPSGDDCLGGVLIALSVTGRSVLRDRLWRLVQPHLARTGDISRAHLAAAAEGYGNATLHDLLGAILSGDAPSIPGALAAVASIGHTSGWDTLVGAMIVLNSIAPEAAPGTTRHRPA